MDVEPAATASTTQFSLFQRVGVGCLGFVLLALLLTARWLEPSEQGFGTHRGLGLPKCTVVTLLGVRCPSCGMTTSWAYLTRGQLVASLGSNTGGALVGLVAMAIVPWSLIGAFRGKPVGGAPGSGAVLICLGVVIGVTMLDWIYRLM